MKLRQRSRIASIILVLAALLTAISACGQQASSVPKAENRDLYTSGQKIELSGLTGDLSFSSITVLEDRQDILAIVQSTEGSSVCSLLTGNVLIEAGQFDELRSSGEVSLSRGRLYARKTVDGSSQWGVISVFNGEEIVPFEYDDYSAINDQYRIYEINSYEQGGVQTCFFEIYTPSNGTPGIFKYRLNEDMRFSVTAEKDLTQVGTVIGEENTYPLGAWICNLSGKTSLALKRDLWDWSVGLSDANEIVFYDEEHNKKSFIDLWEASYESDFTVLGQAFLEDKFVAVVSKPVSEDENEYSYSENGQKYRIETRIFDLNSGETTVKETEYLPRNTGSWFDTYAIGGKPYLFFSAYRIRNHALSTTVSYIYLDEVGENLLDNRETQESALRIAEMEGGRFLCNSGLTFSTVLKDAKGNLVLDLSEYSVGSYGWDHISLGKNGKYGMIDLQGVIRVPFIYENALCFFGDYAVGRLTETIDGVEFYVYYSVRTDGSSTEISRIEKTQAQTSQWLLTGAAGIVVTEFGESDNPLNWQICNTANQPLMTITVSESTQNFQRYAIGDMLVVINGPNVYVFS